MEPYCLKHTHTHTAMNHVNFSYKLQILLAKRRGLVISVTISGSFSICSARPVPTHFQENDAKTKPTAASIHPVDNPSESTTVPVRRHSARPARRPSAQRQPNAVFFSAVVRIVSPGRLVLRRWLHVSAGSHPCSHAMLVLLAIGSVTVSQVVGHQG